MNILNGVLLADIDLSARLMVINEVDISYIKDCRDIFDFIGN